MALLTQFMTFFISPFSEPSSHAELNNFFAVLCVLPVSKGVLPVYINCHCSASLLCKHRRARLKNKMSLPYSCLPTGR